MGRNSTRICPALIAIAALACGGESEEFEDPAAARGAKIYRNICLVCHHADPSQAGALGPAIAGASRELLEAKVLRGEYPVGYTPQRNTQQMPQFAFLEPNLDDLAAFLASPRE